MSDTFPPPATVITTSPVDRRVEDIRTSARWMPWAGFILAVLWWISVAVAIVTSMDLDLLLAQPPITLAAGAVMALLPGLLILMAGIMARESARAAQANALVLQAANQLLAPVQATSAEAESLAARLSSSAKDVDHAMGQALGAMKALSSEIGDERLRLESVGYAAADNARDLAAQLGQERASLEGLVRDLRTQGDTLNEAIPRQAQNMVEAARLAAEEIGRADNALDTRVNSMRHAGQALASELARLNQMAGDAGAHSESLMHAIARVEDKLEQSKRTVDMAVRASDSAVEAAGSTGEALQAAISSALDDARRASLEIQKRTRESGEEAAMQIQVLRQSAEQASAALKAVGVAARAESDLTEKRLNHASNALKQAVNVDREAPAPAMEIRQPLTPSIPPASPEPKPVVPEPDPLFASPPAAAPPAPARTIDSELFEVTPTESELTQEPPPERRVPVLRQGFDAPSVEFTSLSVTDVSEPRDAPPPFDPLKETAPERELNAIDAVPPTATNPGREMGWSTILNDMDRKDTGELSREATAERVIRRLESAGMTLANIFRPKDKRKIAAAARKGETQRRSAIRTTAKFELDRVTSRVLSDGDFVEIAREFVALENADAMAALDRTQKSSRNASPRLSAFLLLDAALGK